MAALAARVADRLRERRRWLIVFAVLLAVRALLPEIVRRVLVSQATQQLHTRVDVGDVDLALVRGGVVLKDVVVHAPQAHPPLANDGAATASIETQPLLSWKQLAVSVHWLPLLRKTIRLREVVLDSPRITLERLSDGRLNLLALAGPPSAVPAPTPVAPTAAQTSTWGFGADRLVLRDGGVHFRDLTLAESEPVEVNISSVEVADVAFQPGVYGEPAQLHVALALEDGLLRVDARVALLDHGIGVQANIDAQHLPLQSARVYVPHVGWRTLQGSLDATLTYQLETGVQDAVRGVVALHDVVVRVPDLEEPALAWRELAVQLDSVDLLAHRVVIGTVVLDGALLPVRPRGGTSLPLLTAAVQSAVAPNSGAPPVSANAVASAPWHWQVSSLHVSDSRVHVLGAAAPFEVAMQLGVSDLADDQQLAPIDLVLTAGKGSVKAAGVVRLGVPGFAGTVQLSDLSVPDVMAALPGPQSVVQAGQLASDLTVEAGLAMAGAAALPPSDVRLRGQVLLTEAQLAPIPDFSAAAHSIELTLTELRIPGVLPAASVTNGDLQLSGRLTVGDLRVATLGPKGFSLASQSVDLTLTDVDAALPQTAGAQASGDLNLHGHLGVTDVQLSGPDPKVFSVGTHTLDLPITAMLLPALISGASASVSDRPMALQLGDLKLTGPTVQLTRTPEGFDLPVFSMSPAPDATVPVMAPPPSAPANPPARRIDVSVDSIELAGGRATLVDRVVKPFFSGTFAALNGRVRAVHWPGPAFRDLHLTGTNGQEGKVEVFGALDHDKGWLEVNGDKIALVPLNPYATAYSSYSVARGALSLATKMSIDSGHYDINSWLTLHDFNVAGAAGDSLFQQEFGVPLTMALALLRDLSGNIVVGIPMQVDASGTKVDVLSIIGGALKRAIVYTLASPLKLLGALLPGSGDTVKAAAPAPIAFRPGRAQLARDGVDALKQLGDVLVERPAVAIQIDATVTATDVRWLREQALLNEWANAGTLATLQGLTQRSTRERVRKALEARAKDEPGELSPEDTAALDRWIADRPTASAEHLRTLAIERVAQISGTLQKEHGIEAARVLSGEPSSDVTDGVPAARIELRPR